MKTISRMFMAASALAVAGCTALPGANLGGTFSAEDYLGSSISGGDFNSSLAREYQALATRSATKDVNWLDATAYIAKSEAAAAGGVAPWSPADLGVEAAGLTELQNALAANSAARPAACAKAQAYWDQYLESLSEGALACISAADAKAMYDDALKACIGVEGDYVVYFGFDKSNMTTAAMAVVDDVVTALKSFAQPLVSIVGHTDTSGSVAYNQSLSERRANSVESAILSRASNMGVTVGSVTKAGRSESELAVQTGDGVREPRNRRATIAISE
ncbi:MAG: OOP family OmpA-OmpF porin [Paracoccaceae bacterium]|jgi:outer membrane protein OmpA-like peptidoglycan-associated protein